MSNIKILLADDHPLLREGIRQVLEREEDFEVVGEAGDGNEAIRLARELLPNVIVMDIHMPNVSGLEATKQIKAEHPSIAVLVLTVHDEDEYVVRLLTAGAAGYLLKDVYFEELVHAIRAVQAGECVLHPVARQRLLKRAAITEPKDTQSDDVEQLTVREVQVLKLAAKGMSNKEIAKELGIEVPTVKWNMLNIFGKMRVGSRTEAVLFGLKKGWINLDDND